MTKQEFRRAVLATVVVAGVAATSPVGADQNDEYVIPGKEVALEALVGAQPDGPGPDTAASTFVPDATAVSVAPTTTAPKTTNAATPADVRATGTLVEIGRASFRLPQGWKTTMDSPSDKMFESPDGKFTILAFWWFPDEPLTGYQDEVSVKHVMIDHESVTRITSKVGQTLAIQNVSERARADEHRFIFTVESSSVGMDELAVVNNDLVKSLRLQPALDPNWTEPRQSGFVPTPPPPAQIVDRDRFTPIDANYSVYENDRYGTVISYPSSYFLPEAPPGNGDGRRFTSVDGTAEFYVFAQFNALEQSQKEQMQQDKADPAHGHVTYERAGPGWYVLSGTTGDVIFYRRVIEDLNGLIRVFEIRYPIARKSDFDAVVTYMANSFGPGTN